MLSDILLNLTKQFSPSGRAFRILKNSIKEKFFEALNVSEATAIQASKDILNSILPDNANFTTEDAANWERRLGIITNDSTSLDARKLAIKRKINHPGYLKARQHPLYLQKSLQDAGFDLYVFENKFFEGGVWITKQPSEVFAGAEYLIAYHTPQVRHGNIRHGLYGFPKVANHVKKQRDDAFDIGSNYRSTFFICGSTLGQMAVIEATRELEFRQLVLRLKPAQTIAYYYILFAENLVVNSTFDTDLTGWSQEAIVRWTWDAAGRAKYNDANEIIIYQNVLTIGKSYRIIFNLTVENPDVSGGVQASCDVLDGNFQSPDDNNSAVYNSTQLVDIILVASAETFGIRGYSNSTDIYYIDNVIVYEL